ncbi:hypothetical protein H4R18_001922 [Coemansia javaensis]|uniref:RecA family profile 1 domain-containing protein n=1 Tax=Coemansia javaensis TaxID=2761396 RepID=A0A9W8HJY3_9FUNG|nr:hypothetical protein H4R18_001922 [Coemansia javaensis]
MLAEIEALLAQVRTEAGRDALAAASAPAPAPPSPVPALGPRALRTGVGAMDAAGLGPVDASRPVVELAGAPGSGKTQTLYRICATLAAAPPGGHVLFVDAAGTADARALARSMRSSAADEALRRVHLFAPPTTAALVATLAMLPRYAAERAIAPAALLIDGLGCNHWIDRKESSHLRLQIKRATPWFRQQQLLADTVHAACAALRCPAFAANTLLLRDRATSTDTAAVGDRTIAVGDQRYRDHMVARWRSIVARTFVLDSAVSADHPGLTRVTFTVEPAAAAAAAAGTATAAGAPQREARAAFVGPLGLVDRPEHHHCAAQSPPFPSDRSLISRGGEGSA